jgi:hypothetical protein
MSSSEHDPMDNAHRPEGLRLAATARRALAGPLNVRGPVRSGGRRFAESGTRRAAREHVACTRKSGEPVSPLATAVSAGAVRLLSLGERRDDLVDAHLSERPRSRAYTQLAPSPTHPVPFGEALRTVLNGPFPGLRPEAASSRRARGARGRHSLTRMAARCQLTTRSQHTVGQPRR